MIESGKWGGNPSPDRNFCLGQIKLRQIVFMQHPYSRDPVGLGAQRYLRVATDHQA